MKPTIPAMSPLEAEPLRDSINLPFFEDQFPSIYSKPAGWLIHHPLILPFDSLGSNSPTLLQLGHTTRAQVGSKWHKNWSKVPRLIQVPALAARRNVASSVQRSLEPDVKRPKVVNNSVVGMTKMKSSWVFVWVLEKTKYGFFMNLVTVVVVGGLKHMLVKIG